MEQPRGWAYPHYSELVKLREKNERLETQLSQSKQLRDADHVYIKKLERAVEASKQSLKLYSLMKPEQIYASAGMSDDDQVEYLKSHPELLLKMDGGRDARETLVLIAQLSGEGEK